jgi:hypothetical protein
MAYYIDIIDTTSPLTQLVLEDASASGIVLQWNGSDSKDEMAIVSSEFNFDMLTKTAKDAAFINFFSGDEHRFKVLVKNDVDDSIIWQGYVLPDLYSEPYKNGCFFVSFTASDGLGRLKGKYLPEDYYSREKSLIDIFCQCLKLTGIELDLFFNPAIENFVNKDWNTIYIDTATFLDKDKKQDAYRILETLLKDTLCLCYQADNRWYIEGINTRQIRQVIYKVYDVSGKLTGTFGYNRLLKEITALATPTFTIIPPYNEITISHKKTAPDFPAEVSKETIDGWALVTGVKGEIHATEWMGNGGYYLKCTKPNYNCTLFNMGYFVNDQTVSYAQDDSKFGSLKQKIYIAKGQKIKFNFSFKIRKPQFPPENPTDLNVWKNPFKYEIIFNNVVLYSNFGGVILDQETLIFDDSAKATLAIEHIFLEEGLIDLRFYAPPGEIDENRILGIEISEASIDVIDFQEDERIVDLINREFTIDKEVELVYADDKSGFSSFRLKKLKEATTFYNEIEVPILYVFVLKGKYYSVVQLEGANLIKENQYSVYKNGDLVVVNAVEYNFNDGEQMVVETALPYTSGSFTVKKYAVDDVVESRKHWLQWTDAVYKIENTVYSKTVANIYRRMFNEAHEKFDCTVLNAVKFNDLIFFNYVYVKDFMVLNCSWNLDENKTTLTLGRTNYKDAGATTPGDENIPPIVVAGDDIYLTNTQTTASALATAYDPDGSVVSQVWTKTAGGFGDVVDTPFALATSFSNLTQDFYTYQIQVTDSEGATAIDSLNIIRIKDYVVTLNLVSEVVTQIVDAVSKRSKKYQLLLSPSILPTDSLALYGVFEGLVNMSGSKVSMYAAAGYSIEKNGVVIESTNSLGNSQNIPITLNYIASDVIYITLNATGAQGLGTVNDFSRVKSKIKLNTVTVTNGNLNISGLPLEEESYMTTT